MRFRENFRYFFVVYNNGEVFNFTINRQGEITCREFEKVIGEDLLKAHYIEFNNTDFILQDRKGRKICSLNDYKKIVKNSELSSLIPANEPTEIERIYIDEDVRTELLETGKLKYNEEISNTPGLLSEPVEENTYTKKRKK